MFAREGYPLIAGALGLGTLLAYLGQQLPPWGRWPLSTLAVLIPGLTLWFFRDPERTPPAGADTLLLAPADGKVVVLEEVDEPLYLKGRAKQISIFLSPLNVHVNRSPAAGTIEFDQYVPGDYLVAWHPKASEKNERSQLGLRHPSGTPVLFKQIAGAVARRIVYHVGVGDQLKAGERFGLVKFGSRMDILVPPEVQIQVRVGDRVTAGETILGRLPAAPAADAPPPRAVMHEAS
ncbi:MAG: phosphatidylserine decarboxylase family protein [Bacteroidota bacterium]